MDSNFEHRIPNVLGIGASDPTASTGVLADLKAFGARGVYGMGVITALTAQNTQCTGGTDPIPPEFIAAQLAALAMDVRLDAVKIGMLPSAHAIHALLEALPPEPPVVLDPQMIAASGAHLMPDDAIQALIHDLMPRTTVLVVNTDEAAALLHIDPAQGTEEMAAQALRLAELGPDYVLLTGGRLGQPSCADVMASDHGLRWFEAERIEPQTTRGSGCTLSAALTAELARGASPEDAAETAKAYLTACIRAGGRLSVGHGHAPVDHFYAFFPDAPAHRT
ncbi:bifunctional hydroxymethylpyrimidine kinase/phosphomethylpyrimidine kinase [Halovulum sp. GXIMD14794]